MCASVPHTARRSQRFRWGVPLACALVLAACGASVETPTQVPYEAALGSSPRPSVAPPATATPRPSATKSAGASAACTPTDQDRYVYNPDRLLVKASCLRVTGVVDAVREEADGDLHILLRLDAPYRKYLTPANQGVELGDLVVEPICVHAVTQADAVASCRADPDPLQHLPHSGMRIWMEGRYVLDTDHGDWAELHPLYRWGQSTTAGGTTTVPAPTQAATQATGSTGSGLRVRFTQVPSPGQIGGSATIGARTSAGATCSLRVALPSGRVSTVAALGVVETADGSGNVSWTWSIRSNTRAGTASATVSCTRGTARGSASTTFPMR